MLAAPGDGDTRGRDFPETRRGVGASLQATCEHGTGHCAHTPAADCESQDGVYSGDGTRCGCAAGPPVPAVGGIGFAVMVVVLVGVDGIVFGRAKRVE